MNRPTKNLFPLGVATGAAHCNRKKEREELKAHIRSSTHTWLWARRRMGKTSLIEQVLGELNRARPAIPSVALDLNVVHDAESLEAKIRQAAAELSIKLVPKQQKPPKLLLRVFERFRPEFTLGGLGMKMTLRPTEAAYAMRWNKPLEDVVLKSILTLTRRHPYYVNALCAEIWQADKIPTALLLSAAWKDLVAKDTALAAQAVRTLSATQRAMLVGIALADRVEHPTGREFLARIRLSASTGSAAKRVLEEQDLVRETDGRWELIDPLMVEYIRATA
jgi:hypothetical protein